jgi:hypothetical protein
MTNSTSPENGLGARFPSPSGRALLALLLPTRRREELVGDLIEEAETVILPREGAATARRWFWKQAVSSASPLWAHQSTQEINMNRWKWLTLVLLLVAGPLMALDPNVFGSTPFVIGLVAAAIAVPVVAGLLSGNLYTLAGAAVVSATLLLAARLVSGIEIRWYAMAFIFFVILRIGQIFERRLSTS